MPKNRAETLIQDNTVTYTRYFNVPIDLAFVTAEAVSAVLFHRIQTQAIRYRCLCLAVSERYRFLRA